MADFPISPPVLSVWLAVFRPCFTAPLWNHVLVLVAGAVLAPGKRTVTQALRAMGLGDEPGFGRYYEALNRARWNARGSAQRLLLHVRGSMLPAGPVVIGIDDTIERRWGARIKGRDIYRDPVRSSKGHFVKTSSLRWRLLMVIVPIPWAARRWALPFLTVLAPSARWSDKWQAAKDANGMGPPSDPANKTLAAQPRTGHRRRQRLRALDLLAAVRTHVCIIARLRLNANLFKPPPARKPNLRGWTPLKGSALPKLSAVLKNAKTKRTSVIVSQTSNTRCKPPPARPSGMMASWSHYPFVGSWSAIRSGNMSHNRSLATIST